MSRFLAPILAVLALAAGCTSDVDTPAEPAAPACDPALDAWAARGFSGAVAVAGGDAPGCRGGYGEADRGSRCAQHRRHRVPPRVGHQGVHRGRHPRPGRTTVRSPSTTGPATSSPASPGPAAEVTVEQLLLPHERADRRRTASRPRAADPRRGGGGDRPAGARRSPPGTDVPVLQRRLHAARADRRGRGRARPTATTWRREVLTAARRGRAGGFWDGEPAAPGPRAVGYAEDGAAGDDGELRRARTGRSTATAAWP